MAIENNDKMSILSDFTKSFLKDYLKDQDILYIKRGIVSGFEIDDYVEVLLTENNTNTTLIKNLFKLPLSMGEEIFIICVQNKITNSFIFKIETFIEAPSSSTSSGVSGQTAYDNNYMYICVATNTWKRVALNTW